MHGHGIFWLVATTFILVHCLPRKTAKKEQRGAYFKSIISTKEDSGQDWLRCFTRFDNDRDEFLEFEEFQNLLLDLFTDANENNSQHQLMIRHLYRLFANEKVLAISKDQFEILWRKWIVRILWPVAALILVDVQNDFINGTLSLHNAVEIIPVVNSLLDQNVFKHVVYTYDWHPADHISFYENRHLRRMYSTRTVSHLRESWTDIKQGPRPFDEVIFLINRVQQKQILWPAHCVQNTTGSELHPLLKVQPDSIHLYKGTDSNRDSYSAFFDNDGVSQTSLHELLQQRHVNQVYVAGLAYDVCVGYTAKDAIRLGYQTILIDDASKGVHTSSVIKTFLDVSARGLVIHAHEVPSLVTAADRRLQLGYAAAVNVHEDLMRPFVDETEHIEL